MNCISFDFECGIPIIFSMARSSNEMPFLLYTTTKLESPSAPLGRALGVSLNTELDMTAALLRSATVHSIRISFSTRSV